MTLTILPLDNIHIFLNHLNFIHENIQFTIELQANNSLAFLDVLVIRNPNGTVEETTQCDAEHLADELRRRTYPITRMSAVCEHTVDKPSHYIGFNKFQIFAKENRYIPIIIHEAIEKRISS